MINYLDVFYKNFRLSIIQGAKKNSTQGQKRDTKKNNNTLDASNDFPIFFGEINSLDVPSGTSRFNNRFEEYNRFRNNRFRNFQFRNWLLHYRL